MTAVAIDGSGHVLRAGRGKGVNSFVAPEGATSLRHGLGRMLKGLVEALEADAVKGVVLGVAGSLARPEVSEDVTGVMASLGITVEPLVVNDAEIMFASGTTAADGHCLSVGTGAIGVAIRQRRVARTVDGHGWMLGDGGSSVWIGLAAIRAVLRALDGRGEDTLLIEGVCQTLERLTRRPCPVDPFAIVRAAHSVAPAALGQIAPSVEKHSQLGDAAARRILDDAAEALASTLVSVVGDQADLPIVLGGSVAYGNTTIRTHLERVAENLWPDSPVHVVKGGAPGAALWASHRAGHQANDEVLARIREQVDTSQESFILDS